MNILSIVYWESEWYSRKALSLHSLINTYVLHDHSLCTGCCSSVFQASEFWKWKERKHGWEEGSGMPELHIKIWNRASLVAQWLRVRLPMRGTQVRALVWEDPTCRGAAGPVSHGRWACASGACAPQRERPQQWEACVPQKKKKP